MNDYDIFISGPEVPHALKPATGIVTRRWTDDHGARRCQELLRIEGWSLHRDELERETQAAADDLKVRGITTKQPPRKAAHYDAGHQTFRNYV